MQVNMADVGFLALLLALILSVFSLLGHLFTINTEDSRLLASARGGIAATVVMVSAAALVLVWSLVTNDFSLKYVYDYTTTDLPLGYKVSALWAGNAGSLLLWAWILSLFTGLVTFSKQGRWEGVSNWVAVILLVNLIFFISSMVLFANPFEKNPMIPVEGHGLNPMLRNPWMVIHPVTLYLGYVGLAVPFAFAMANLMAGRADDQWIEATRRWTVISWLFLSLGNLFGAQWAYVELGWGGYWAWDPVENASFLPWLTSSAFLHSVMVQERRGMLKIFNIVLIIFSYWLTLYGTFLVRSGVLSSVHAFPRSNLSYWFGAFMFAVLLWSLFLLISRKKLLKERSEFESLLSKETAFLFNNVLLLGSAFVIFWGTNLPLISQVFTGAKHTVGKEWFNSTAGPILLAIMLLMGLCPLLTWQKTNAKKLRNKLIVSLVIAVIFGIVLFLAGIRQVWGLVGFSVVLLVIFNTLGEFIRGYYSRLKSTGEGPVPALAATLKNRRRYGGYLIHMGLILITLGVVGSSFFNVETIKTVNVGDRIEIDKINKYQLEFNGVRGKSEGRNEVIFSDLKLTKNGRPAGTITPEKIYYPNWESPRTEVAIRGGPVEDLYVMLAGWANGGKQGTFEVHVNPLINWLWIGGYVLLAGAIFALWPAKRTG